MTNISYTDQEKVDLVFECLSNNFNDVINQMTNVSEIIKKDPNNTELKNLLYSLAATATKIIGTQISFTHVYVAEKDKENIIDKLMEKKQQLLSKVATELSDLNTKTKSR